MRAFREEIFGPVASVTTFQSDEEAVALASDTEYGLSLSIISSSLDRGLALSKRIPAGLVHINDQTIGDDPSPRLVASAHPATVLDTADRQTGRSLRNGSG